MGPRLLGALLTPDLLLLLLLLLPEELPEPLNPPPPAVPPVVKGVKYCIAILLSAKIHNSYCSGETKNY